MELDRSTTGTWRGRLAALSGMLVLLLLFFGAPAAARQAGSVSGTVVDERGNSIANAQVIVVGSTLRALTNAEGIFRVAGLPTVGQVTLRVTMIGFRSVTETVQIGTGGIRLRMARAAIALDAIVVTGTAAGVQQARAIGNTVSKIQVSELLEYAPIPDVSSMLNGRAPGVVVTPGTGQVGGGPTIRIRGASSFSLSTQPLIYVDGVRLDNAIGTGISVQGFGSGIVNRLNDINPEDIESIEIIKGPAAATLYGTEAANGVIQIITKKGRVGRTEISLNLRQGVNWFKDAEGRIDQNWGFEPVTGEPYKLNLFENERSLGNPSIFESGRLKSYGANIAGGTELVRYYVSADVDFDEGAEPTNDLWRLSTRVNLTIAPDPKYDIVASLGYSQGRTNLACEAGCGGRMWATVFGNPNTRDTDFRGFRSYPPEIISEAFAFWQDAVRTQISFQFNHRPANWFQHRLTAGQDRVAEENTQLWERMSDKFVPFFGTQTRAGGKFLQRRDVETSTFDYSATAMVNLSNSISSSTTVGAQYYRSFTELVVAEGNTFPAPGLTVVDALAETFGGDFFIENNTLGAFAQQQISFNERVFITGAIRGDDNSAFGRDFDFVVYPKISASWMIGEEDFWKVGFVDALKLRAAFGQSGQQPDAFAAVRTFGAITGGGGVAALTPDVIGNDSLGPEVGQEFEVGFEAGLFDNRIGVDFTYYNSRTKDAILSRELPPSLGFPGSQFVNAGEIRNSGFEVQINALAVQKENVNVDFTLNLSTNSNQILDLGGIDQGQGFIPAGSNRHAIGMPTGAWFRRKVVSATLTGTGPTAITSNPMCDSGDPNGKLLPDGTPLELGGPAVPCDGAPRLFLGSVTPTFEGSFAVNVTLRRNLRIYGFLDWKTGYRKLDNNLRARCQVFNSCEENFFPENFDAAVIAEMQSGSPLRSFVFTDAGFAKIREVAVSWTMPQSLVRWVGADRATLTVAGRNLHTFTGYSGLDPEASFIEFGFSLLEQDNTPQLASFVATLNVSF